MLNTTSFVQRSNGAIPVPSVHTRFRHKHGASSSTAVALTGPPPVYDGYRLYGEDILGYFSKPTSLFRSSLCSYILIPKQKGEWTWDHETNSCANRVYFIHILVCQFEVRSHARKLFDTCCFPGCRHQWNTSLITPAQQHFRYTFLVVICNGAQGRVSKQSPFV